MRNRTTLIAYRRPRVLLAAAFSAAFGAASLMFWLHPEDAAAIPSVWFRSLSGPVGHWLVFPPVATYCTILAMRLALIAARHPAALEINDEGVTINGKWGSRPIAWRELERVERRRVVVRGNKFFSLCFRAVGRCTILPLHATDLGDFPHRIDALVADLMRRRNEALTIGAARRPALKPAGPSRAGFGRRAA